MIIPKATLKEIKPKKADDKSIPILHNLKWSLENYLRINKQDMDEEEIDDYKETIKDIEEEIRRRKNDKCRQTN